MNTGKWRGEGTSNYPIMILIQIINKISIKDQFFRFESQLDTDVISLLKANNIEKLLNSIMLQTKTFYV